jgi:heme oxygenase
MLAEDITLDPACVYLKQHTRHLHSALDQLPPLQQLAKGKFDSVKYLHCLKCFYSAYLNIEDALLAVEHLANLSHSLTYQARRFSLETELFTAGVTLPIKPAAPELKLNSLPAYLGCRYVLEGSSLGAQFLLPRIQACLGPDIKLVFFEHLSQQSKKWHDFIALLNDSLNEPHHKAAAIQAAEETFAIFHHYFSIKE